MIFAAGFLGVIRLLREQSGDLDFMPDMRVQSALGVRLLLLAAMPPVWLQFLEGLQTVQSYHDALFLSISSERKNYDYYYYYYYS